MLARLGNALAPGEVWALRIPATLCAVLTVLFVALLVREMAGSRRAELIASGAFSCSTLALLALWVLAAMVALVLVGPRRILYSRYRRSVVQSEPGYSSRLD